MNLVTFNIDDELLGGHYQKIIKKKKIFYLITHTSKINFFKMRVNTRSRTHLTIIMT